MDLYFNWIWGGCNYFRSFKFLFNKMRIIDVLKLIGVAVAGILLGQLFFTNFGTRCFDEFQFFVICVHLIYVMVVEITGLLVE